MAKLKETDLAKIFFIASIVLAMVVWYGRTFDVYEYAFTGALFELLWLPFLFLMAAFPALLFVYWARDKHRITSLHFYSLLISLATVILFFLLG